LKQQANLGLGNLGLHSEQHSEKAHPLFSFIFVLELVWAFLELHAGAEVYTPLHLIFLDDHETKNHVFSWLNEGGYISIWMKVVVANLGLGNLNAPTNLPKNSRWGERWSIYFSV
jgi:hypothetical protein